MSQNGAQARNRDRDERTRPLSFNPGLPSTAAATLMVAISASMVALTADTLVRVAAQAAALGLIMALTGLLIGSPSLIGLATIPVLGGAMAGTESSIGPAWGRSLIIGCLWYVSVELAWSAIEQRNETVRTPAIAQHRAREVATVVIVSLALGLAAAGVATFAPARTLLVRALMIAAVLIALGGAVRRLSLTAPPVHDSTS